VSNPYLITVNGVTMDCYDITDAVQFEQSAVAHAFKKMFAMGKRSGGKSYEQDLDDMIRSLTRAKEQLRGKSERPSADVAGRTTGNERPEDTFNSAGVGTKGGAVGINGTGSDRPPPPPEDQGLEAAFKWLADLDAYIINHNGIDERHRDTVRLF
jgi:hypothetical protein